MITDRIGLHSVLLPLLIILTPSSLKCSVFRKKMSMRKNAKPASSNSSGLKSVFEKLRFRGGLVWTVGPVNLRFQLPPKNENTWLFLVVEEVAFALARQNFISTDSKGHKCKWRLLVNDSNFEILVSHATQLEHRVTYVRANTETWAQVLFWPPFFGRCWTTLLRCCWWFKMVKLCSELVLSSLKVNTSLCSVLFFCRGYNAYNFIRSCCWNLEYNFDKALTCCLF